MICHVRVPSAASLGQQVVARPVLGPEDGVYGAVEAQGTQGSTGVAAVRQQELASSGLPPQLMPQPKLCLLWVDVPLPALGHLSAGAPEARQAPPLGGGSRSKPS